MSAAAFYTVADDRYFLGAAGLVNSLRLVGHSEPVYVLDCGLTAEQRELLGPAGVELVDGPRGVPGNLLKTIAPLAHPAEGSVLIDADIIVTRHLGELVERGLAGEVLAFGTGMDRFEPAWGELGMGAAEPRPYLCSALVFCGGELGAEIVRLMDERRDRVDWERTYWRANDESYPLVHADQDLFNAVLTTRVEPARIAELEGRLMAFPPFEDLRVTDERELRCAYGDGTEPYVLHHWNAKPWLEPSHHGPYSRLLRRLLLGDDVPVRVPEEMIPLRLRSGPLAWAERMRVNASERLRWHVGDPLAERVGRSARHEPRCRRMSDAAAKAKPSAAFYCVADARYFLGAVGLVNSLRVLGHAEPIHLTDCGLTPEQRDLLAPAVELVDAPPDTPPALLKTIGPNRHPADVIVQLDTDLLATRHFGDLIETAAAGKLVAFANKSDRWVPEWGELLDLGELRRQHYLDFAALCMHSSIAAEVQPLIEDRQDRIDFERTYWGRQDPDYSLLYADQDVMNAIVAARVGAEETVILPGRLAPVPPFEGLRVADEATLECAYDDGERPYVVHHHIVKPWLVPTQDGVYSRLLRRLLVGDGLAVRVPPDQVPLRFRSGIRASAERGRINARERLRR